MNKDIMLYVKKPIPVEAEKFKKKLRDSGYVGILMIVEVKK